MRPAFSSTRQAALFAALIAIALALPAIVARTKLLDRRDVYPAIPTKWGGFPFAQQKIFQETSDVDIAFLGSSRIWNSVDTPLAKEQLSRKLGRAAEVFTLGWPWAGFDADYIVARDLLAHRRVHVLVVGDEDIGPDDPHMHAARWFRMGENSEALDGLSRYAQARLYGSAILGMPRQLLSALRPNLLEDPRTAQPSFWNTYYRAPNVATVDGALRARLAFGSAYAVFDELPTLSNVSPDGALIYSPSNTASFQVVENTEVHPYQSHFLRKLAKLCAEHDTKLVLLNTPFLHERDMGVIIERKRWSEIVGDAPMDVLGVVPNRMFAGVEPDNVIKYFYEDAHPNVNGQTLFTQHITPRLLELYDQAVKQHP